MACSVKRANPFDDSESLSSSLKRLHCSSPTRTSSMDSPTGTDGSTYTRSSGSSQSSPFPDLPNGDFSQKILSELRKLHQRIQAKTDPLAEGDGQGKDVQQATFNANQVRFVCQKLLKEREIEVRAEYDRVLNARLAEQYETFVKFAQDQIHNQQSRTGEPSYFS